MLNKLRLASILGFLLAVAMSACSSCPEGPCDALRSPSADDAQSAIAGVIAGEDDVGGGHGCRSCWNQMATMSFWKTDALISNASEARTVVQGSPETKSLDVSGPYRQPLDPGHYLVCRDRWACVAVEVGPNHVTTVHMMVTAGPPQFTVFDAPLYAKRTPDYFNPN
jgi:hypothetical protein